jgi:hypothetical protein
MPTSSMLKSLSPRSADCASSPRIISGGSGGMQPKRQMGARCPMASAICGVN